MFDDIKFLITLSLKIQEKERAFSKKLEELLGEDSRIMGTAVVEWAQLEIRKRLCELVKQCGIEHSHYEVDYMLYECGFTEDDRIVCDGKEYSIRSIDDYIKYLKAVSAENGD